MTKSASIDWNAVELEYRAGIRSLRAIGAQFGVSDAGIIKRAKRDSWVRGTKPEARKVGQYTPEQTAAKKAYAKIWYAANAEKSIAAAKLWYLENTDKAREREKRRALMNPEKKREATRKWRLANPDRIKTVGAQWQKDNAALTNVFNAKRRAAKLQATPAWADEFLLSEAYELAQLRSKATGVVHHVDHIVPLRGKTVCGLHCEFNVRVIPGKENLRKSNRHWPDMP